MDDKRFPSDRKRDPIADLARLIAEIDSHEEHTASDDGLREGTGSDGHDETSELPPAPQLAVDLKHHQAWDRDEEGSDDQAHDVNGELSAADEEYEDPYANEESQDNEVPRVRRRSLIPVMAILGLVLVGSACAVGYRNISAGSVSPTLPSNIEVVNERNSLPPASDPQAVRSGAAREIGPVTTGSINNMVSHEDQPAAVGLSKIAPHASLPQTSVPATPTAGQAKQKQAATGVAAVADPPPATTPVLPQRPSQSSGTNTTDHKPPLAQLTASSPAAVTDPALAQSYAVQVTSERSESNAQAAFRALQAKYPSQLGGQQPIIRRADLGAAGTYYRALVGSFASAEKAARMCSKLKAAGGNCVILKN
jgi:hypothetical protein